jgi:hypothetical protein
MDVCHLLERGAPNSLPIIQSQPGIDLEVVPLGTTSAATFSQAFMAEHGTRRSREP